MYTEPSPTLDGRPDGLPRRYAARNDAGGDGIWHWNLAAVAADSQAVMIWNAVALATGRTWLFSL